MEKVKELGSIKFSPQLLLRREQTNKTHLWALEYVMLLGADGSSQNMTHL